MHNQCSQIAHGNLALTNLRKYVNLSTPKCAYYGMIYPHLQYCSSLRRLASKTSLTPVQTLQNKALKIMTKTSWHHFASPLYQKSQLLKFNDIVKLQLAKIMHSVHNNKISNLYFGFSKVEKFHHYCTRNSTKSNFVQTLSKFPRELKKANQPFLSQAQKYGVRYLVIWKIFLITPLNTCIRDDCLTAILNN